ncbi:MAG: hypothetical protein MRZ79_02270 [Bacteroidia bacterium]|nr:hypothetical protein [Bacteroidia bacterium]
MTKALFLLILVLYLIPQSLLCQNISEIRYYGFENPSLNPNANYSSVKSKELKHFALPISTIGSMYQPTELAPELLRTSPKLYYEVFFTDQTKEELVIYLVDIFQESLILFMGKLYSTVDSVYTIEQNQTFQQLLMLNKRLKVDGRYYGHEQIFASELKADSITEEYRPILAKLRFRPELVIEDNDFLKRYAASLLKDHVKYYAMLYNFPELRSELEASTRMLAREFTEYGWQIDFRVVSGIVCDLSSIDQSLKKVEGGYRFYYSSDYRSSVVKDVELIFRREMGH